MEMPLTTVRTLAATDRVQVQDVVCRASASDRPYEEQHGRFVVAAVLGGSFRYRSTLGDETLVPGSILLGNPDQIYRCSHEYCTGDRCLSFGLAPELVASVAEDLGVDAGFRRVSLPPGEVSVGVIAEARVAATRGDGVALESAAVTLVAAAIRSRGVRPRRLLSRDAARAAEAARYLDTAATERLTLTDVAARYDTSPFHFLRSFRSVLGITPHQYLIEARLRRAARLLATTDRPVTDIAFESGFGDLTNFIRTFRADTGESPGTWRRRIRG